MDQGIGLACLAATTTIVITRPQSAVVGVITLVLACLALLPMLFSGIVAVFDYTQRALRSTSTRLAVGELRDPETRVRSLAIAATGAVAVFGSVAIAGAQRNLQGGLDSGAHEWNRVADIWVSTSGISNTLGTTPFPASVGSVLHDVGGVSGVRLYRGTFLNIGRRRVWIVAPPRLGPDPMPEGQLVAGDPRLVNARLRASGWAVVSEAIASERHLHVGGSFILPAPFPLRFRVAGLVTNGGWPPGAIVLNATDYARAWGSTAVSALNVTVRKGYAPSDVRTAISRALGSTRGLSVETAAEREAEWNRLSRQGLGRLTQISDLVLVAAVLAMAGVMTSLLWQRRERIAYLKRTGNTRGLLWRSLFWESAVLLGSGCLIGAVFGLYGQLVISHALASVTGFPIAISVGAFIAIFSFLVVSASALAIVAAPGYFAVRVRPTMVKPS